MERLKDARFISEELNTGEVVWRLNIDGYVGVVERQTGQLVKPGQDKGPFETFGTVDCDIKGEFGKGVKKERKSS